MTAVDVNAKPVIDARRGRLDEGRRSAWRITHRHALWLACLGALSGCSTVDSLISDSKIDYRTQGAKTNSLEVPPDLTQLARDPRFRPPSGAEVSASALSGTRSGSTATSVSGSSATVALKALEGMSVVREGNQRWLVVPQSPEVLWPRLKDFWTGQGFTLEVDSPLTGVMETAWAENRAKLPQDIIRSTIGKIFEGIYSTSERDRFRTRIERGASGTEIYITHRGLEEVYTSASRDRTVWQPRAVDPQLEAEFLTRLMVQLGSPEASARQAVARPAEKPADVRSVDAGGTGTLQLDDGFDRAWRRVALALDRSGFTVEDRDREAGLFHVRYVDPAVAGREEPNFFSKLLGRGNSADELRRYRVQLKSAGDKTMVSLQRADGSPASAEDAKQILARLAADLR